MSNSFGSRRLLELPLIGDLWRRLESVPPPVPEESIWLRVLVQALVIVGIIATDIAAETQISFWAVPLSIVGAFWSYRQRRRANVPVKFLLAIGMLLALGFFFQGLFGSVVNATNDTRSVLAGLLIQVQVLHSFDLPRRKDLGYSTVIGLILIGVAGTLSQTLAFGPFLLLFLAIALPTLVLDYRSRLGLSIPTPRQQKIHKSPQENRKLFKFYLLLFSFILGLGLTVFAVLPRFPGYQLRSFPVSAPIEFQGQFDSSRIFNPRLGRGGGEGYGGAGSGTQQEEGPGQLDDTFYSGFNSQMNMNLRGVMKPKEVMRVRSQSPGFWRVLAFDRYTGQGWKVSRNEQAKKLTRPPWSYQFYLPSPITSNRTKEVIQTYTAISDMPNLIPVLAEPRQLFFPTPEVALDTEGGLRSPVELAEGITYTVISEVPYRNRSALRNAPPLSAKNTPAYKRFQQLYLQVPPQIADKVKNLTEDLLAKSPTPITSSYEKALYLAQALKQRYQLKPGMPFLEKNEDLVEAFLFKYQGGYPDHFSTVLTVMLRSIGIPARLVVGYAPGEFNAFTGFYIVRNTDAYAMSEVYFPKYGWFTFDPIPGHDVIPRSIEENQTFGVLQQFWSWVAGWLPSPVTGFLNRVFGEIFTNVLRFLAWLWNLFFQGWLGLFALILMAIGLGFAGWMSWKGWRAWRYRRWLAKLAPVESIYQQMLAVLAESGFRKHPAQTPLEFARDSQIYYQSWREIVNDITDAYVRWRYGGVAANIPSLSQQLQSLKKHLSRRVSR